LENRFIKALSRLFPGNPCRVYADEATLRRALVAGGFAEAAEAPFPDPAVWSLPSKVLSLWRPFLPVLEHKEDSLLLVPVLPWVLAPKVLIFHPNLDPEVQGFPPSDFLSPVLLAGAIRAIHDLFLAPEREMRNFPEIQGVLSEGIWRRQGIYLHYGEALDEEVYTALFSRFLEEGFLLPPDKNGPLILPGSMSKGEEAKLASLLRHCL
jgi:hypothetical protein